MKMDKASRLSSVASEADKAFMETLHYLIFKCNTSVMVIVFSLICTILAILGVSQCTFVTGASDFRPGGKHTVGLYSLAVYDEDKGQDVLGCVSFPDDVELDFFFRVSRGAGAAMAALMSCSFLLLVRTIVWAPSPAQWNLARICLGLATSAAFLTFAITLSDHCKETECSLSSIGIVNVFNAFIMAGLSLIVCIEPPPSIPWFVYWTEEHFTANKDTLAKGHLNRLEFVSSEDHERSTESSDGDYVFPSQGSVLSQVSIQDSLVSTTQKALQSNSSFRLTLLVSFFIAWLLSILGIRNCNFIMLGGEDQDSSMYLGVGLFTRAFYVGSQRVGCIAHSDHNKENFDGFFQASRVFGAVAALLLSVVLLVAIAQLFSNIARIELWLFIRFLLPCAFVTESLTWLAYFSEICNSHDGFTCMPGRMGFAVMGNLTLLFTLCAACCVLPPPSHPVFARFRPDEEEEEFFSENTKIRSMLPPPNSPLSVLDEGEESIASEDTENKKYVPWNKTSSLSLESNVSVKVMVVDGERKTVKEVTHPDGSRTVTTTIEDLNELHVLQEEEDEFVNDSNTGECFYMT